MKSVTIERAHPDEARAVAELIAAAFEPLAAVSWLVPEPGVRRRVMAGNFLIYVEHALAHGLVYVTADRSGAAVWFPRDGEPLPGPDDYDARLTAACGVFTDRFRILDKLLETHHPDAPHHHLAFLAVDPDRQGDGTGTALLRHHHARLDELGLPAYLEASCERSRDLYLRHGYQASEPFRLPDGTPFWPMWRPPQ